MSDLFSFTTGAASHVGKVRSVNEDRYVTAPELGLWAVADGMGGLGGGDVASTTVVELLAGMERPASAPDLLARFEARIIEANETLKRLAAERGSDAIGSTVAALLVYGRHYAAVWSGDSRVYRLRRGELVQLSHDHTEAQELVDSSILAPEEARTWPRRNVVTRAIGVYDDAELELEHGVIEPADRFLLCSDGLTNYVTDAEIAAAAAGEPQRACDDLVTLTLDRGAGDNVTVVLLRCDPRKSETTVIPEQFRQPEVGRP